MALTGGHNIELLASQAIRVRAEMAVTAFPENLEPLRNALAGTRIVAAAGPTAILEALSRSVDWCLCAAVGLSGLAASLRTLETGGVLALANKESIIAAGKLMRRSARKSGASIIPVDSEHSALFQLLQFPDPDHIRRVTLTASGGPFRDWSLEQMAGVTPEMAVRHPNWAMGKRISVDSATMFNKGLEILEARELFDLPSTSIEVVIHRQSIVHALVELQDTAVFAHLGPPDMQISISHALHWPDRALDDSPDFDLAKVARLEFEEPDSERFPALRLARLALEQGGASGAALVAAKDRALDAFFAREIGFLDMAVVVEKVLEAMSADGTLATSVECLEDAVEVEEAAQSLAAECVAAF